jgi:hypothetical protein
MLEILILAAVAILLMAGMLYLTKVFNFTIVAKSELTDTKLIVSTFWYMRVFSVDYSDIGDVTRIKWYGLAPAAW